jgi:hypothetical protein
VTRGGELGKVVGVEQCAGDAAGPQPHGALGGLGRRLDQHDVGDGEPTAGLEDAEGLAQHRVLVGREVDDQSELTTSTLLPRSGMCSMVPSRNSVWVMPASAWCT